MQAEHKEEMKKLEKKVQSLQDKLEIKKEEAGMKKVHYLVYFSSLFTIGVESSRTHFEVVGLDLEAYKS